MLIILVIFYKMTSYAASLSLESLFIVLNMFYMTTPFSNSSMKSLFKVFQNIVEDFLGNNFGCGRYYYFELREVTERSIKNFMFYISLQKNGCRS